MKDWDLTLQACSTHSKFFVVFIEVEGISLYQIASVIRTKVDVDMLNTIMSVLADVSSVSPSSASMIV